MFYPIEVFQAAGILECDETTSSTFGGAEVTSREDG